MTIFPKLVRVPRCRGKYAQYEVIANARHGEVGVYEKVEHDATAPDVVYLTLFQARHYVT